jgi:predicted GTPase
MFNNVGPTHPKAADAVTPEPTDDVEGHRIAMFIEDQKDSALGPLPTAADDPAPDAADDVEGHRILWATGDPEPEGDGVG